MGQLFNVYLSMAYYFHSSNIKSRHVNFSGIRCNIFTIQQIDIIMTFTSSISVNMTSPLDVWSYSNLLSHSNPFTYSNLLLIQT